MRVKNAVIIGASRGIGRAVSIKLAELGYNLILIGRSQDGLYKTVSECHGVKIHTCAVDITTDLEQLIGMVKEQASGIDVLWLGAMYDMPDKLVDMKDSDIELLIRTGYESQVKLVRSLYSLISQSQGRIIIPGSDELWGKEMNYYGPAVFQSSKIALSAFGKILGYEAASDGLKVTNLLLGDCASDDSSNTDSSLVSLDDVTRAVEYVLTLQSAHVPELQLIPAASSYPD